MRQKMLMLALLASLVVLPGTLRAATMGTPKPAPTPAPPMSASETEFVNAVTPDLTARFATTSAATAAGYYRYTNEDSTGAISWVNPAYWKSDPKHPAQLWYDVNGRLIGADFSVLQAGLSAAPSMWGVSASRFIPIEQHVHYGVKQPDGSVTFGGYGPKSAAKVGGTLSDPTKQDVVKLGKAQTVDQVAFVFQYPAIYDLQVWLVPNPLGPFAEHNPNVKPTKNAEPDM
ncbi:MAG: hypothetical protein JO293_03325 [Candidatus Eremiobacteraeota bacterium]|nr:hypothetical protein [Candidatus Eremiobacteraeota bacterium]